MSANWSLTDVSDDGSRLLQPFWDWLRIGNEDLLCSPMWPVVMSVTFYFFAVFPFMVFDLCGKKWHWIQQYKIQPDKEVTWPMVKQTVWVTLWNHVMYILPAGVAQALWQPPTPLEPIAPTVSEFVFQQIASLLIFDLYYFVWHSVHHRYKVLYRWFHAIHHEYHSPFCWVTQYLHPWELITVGFGTTVIPWIFSPHCLTWWSFMILNIIVSVEAHIGYEFPWATHVWVPFGLYGGSPKHDMHHQKPMTNFEPFFNHLDRIFGSYCPPMAAGGHKSPQLLAYEKAQKLKVLSKFPAPLSSALPPSNGHANGGGAHTNGSAYGNGSANDTGAHVD